MMEVHRMEARRLAASSERTAREMFFAMLAASSLSAVFGLVAFGVFA
jgi:hypothetical protein